jgi:hypothetical protein
VLAIWAGLNAQANRALKRELDRIQAAGDPLVPAQCARPALPDVDNAAPGVLRALAILKTDPGEFTERDRFITDWALVPEMAPMAEAWIGANAPALAELKRAAERPACRYPIDYGKGILADSPGFSAALRSVELLGAAARLAHGRGDAAETDRLIAAAFRLGLDWADEPIQFMSTSGVGFFRKASLLWQAALNAGHPPGPAVRKVIHTLKPGRFSANFRRSLACDRGMLLSWFLNNPEPEIGSDLESRFFLLPPGRPFLKKQLVLCSGVFQAAIDSLGPPPSSRAWTRPMGDLGWLSEIILPDFSRAAGVAIEGDVAMDLARAALAALDADGAWPPPDEALAGVIDRFTDRPVALSRESGRVTMISLGRNLALDGGDAWKDVAFRLPSRRPGQP